MRLLAIALLFGAAPCGDTSTFPDSGLVDSSLVDSGPADSGPAMDASHDAGETTGWVEIGTGLTDFVEVPEGSEVELVMGPQGGWHIEIATRLYGMDPMDLNLRIQGFDAETEGLITIVVERVLTRRRVRDEGDHYLRLGDQLVFAVEDGSQVVGKRVRIEVDATPAGGATVHAEKTVLIVDRMP